MNEAEQGPEKTRVLGAPAMTDGVIDEGIEEVKQQVTMGGIETVRILFPDAHGVLRGKTITAEALPAAMEAGIKVPSTLLLKDISHRTAFPIWQRGEAPMAGASDIVLMPDASTFRTLPWSGHSALMLADAWQITTDGIGKRDLAPVAIAPRQILTRAQAALTEQRFTGTFGLEVEFQIFRVLDSSLAPAQATMPGAPPLVENTTQGYQYLTDTRYDALEPLLDKIRRAAEAMGLAPQSVEVEMGPSQVEFTFAPGPAQHVADKAALFRMLAKEICAREGYLASFMPKPGLPNAAANGWHIHQSFTANGVPFAQNDDPETMSPMMMWIAGLLNNARAACLMTNPTVTSYKRFTAHQLAPNRIGWSEDNRGAMVRVLGQGRSARVENRLPDSAANPYLALAAQIHSGLAPGIHPRRHSPPPPLLNPYDDPGEALPASLGEAIDAFAASDTLREALTPEVHDWLVTLKRFEWDRYLSHISDWEQAEYFANL